MTKDKGKKGNNGTVLFTREWWDGFLDKQGFYVVLFLCVAVIGITAIYTRVGNAPSGNEPVKQGQNGLSDINTDGTANNDETVNMVPDFVQRLSEVTEEMSSGGTTSDSLSAVASPSPTPIKSQLEPKLTWPLDGEILRPCSGGKLVYSDTLNEYRVHSGIDICGKAGDTVTAAFSGKVENEYNDLLLGYVVILTHEGGVQTKYFGLSSCYVTQSASVSQGQPIGTLGTIPIEADDGPHLHFEMTKDGDTVDPRLYLEKKKS